MSFQAWDWLCNPMLWSQRRNRVVHGAEISIHTSALAGVEPRTLESSAAYVITRLPRTPPFSRLLRHAGGYSRTILTPNLHRMFKRSSHCLPQQNLITIILVMLPFAVLLGLYTVKSDRI